MTAKNINTLPGPITALLMATGNVHEMITAKNQCVKLPSDWPFDRIEFGKISEINTHITMPSESPKKNIYPSRKINIPGPSK